MHMLQLIKEIWNDHTTFGKCTIAIPTIILCEVLSIVLFPFLFILYVFSDTKVSKFFNDVCTKSEKYIKSLFYKEKQNDN
jgi:hypothetical protein